MAHAVLITQKTSSTLEEKVRKQISKKRIKEQRTKKKDFVIKD